MCIDSHAHLEQTEYDKDRGKVIKESMSQLKAIITCCARPKDLDLTLELANQYPNFLFATVGLHPMYVNEVTKKQREMYFNNIEKNSEKIYAVGECGLDYKVVESKKEKEFQKNIFKNQIEISKKLSLPLVIHARRAFHPSIELLEDFSKKEVLMHFFTAEKLLNRVIENGWYITTNNTLLWSEEMQKIAQKTPLDKILLETDSPWLGGGKRNVPLNIKKVARKLAELKEKKFETVWNKCGKNSVEFYDLPLKISS